jgi:hypothetical protein
MLFYPALIFGADLRNFLTVYNTDIKKLPLFVAGVSNDFL